MRYIILALAPIVLSFACAHTQPVSRTQTTGADAPLGPGYGGTTDAPAQGWDNTKSAQQAQPKKSIVNDKSSR